MSNIKYCSIQDIQIIQLKNDGDQNNARYSLDMSNLNLKELAVYTKKARTKSDGHFHKGENKSRNPEHLYLIKGCIKFWFEDRNGDKNELVINAGEHMITPAWIFHRYEVLEDCVFLEPREITYTQVPDTYNYEEFKKVKNTK